VTLRVFERPESVLACVGLGVRLAPESVFDLAQCTQLRRASELRKPAKPRPDCALHSAGRPA